MSQCFSMISPGSLIFPLLKKNLCLCGGINILYTRSVCIAFELVC